MLYSVELDRTYNPETVAVMTAAFDAAYQLLSMRTNGSDGARRTWRWQSSGTSIKESATQSGSLTLLSTN
jgi:hypothetical protein